MNIETEQKLTADDVRALLAKSPGIVVEDYPEKKAYPMPINGAGLDDTFVGRIREDDTIENGINMWIVSDNIRKGAALNTVQIAETLIQRDLLRVP